MSTPAMRLAVDHVFAPAVRLSIAAAMVIAKPVHREIFTFFGFGRPLQRNVNKE
jgi:hypothetical protein